MIVAVVHPLRGRDVQRGARPGFRRTVGGSGVMRCTVARGCVGECVRG
jgi:hypothetical protein